MKQTEFEQQLRDMRMQKGQEIAAIAQLQSQVNKERALLNTQYDDLRKRIHTLDIERVSLSQRRMDVEAKWGGANPQVLPRELHRFSRIRRSKRLGSGQRIGSSWFRWSAIAS